MGDFGWPSGTAKGNLKQIMRKESRQNDKIAFLHLAIIHPDVNEKHRIIEDVWLLNVVACNLALISANYEKTEDASFSFLKKVNPQSLYEKIVNARVRNWIKYYLGNWDGLIGEAKKTLDKTDRDSNIYFDIQKDVEIFNVNCQK